MTCAPSHEPTEAHPDRLRWNARHQSGALNDAPQPLARAAEAAGIPAGPVLELACGLSGTALFFARQGRQVTAVDISDIALQRLGAAAAGLALETVHADLKGYRPSPGRYALVLASRYWDREVFCRAAGAVAAGGLLAWETFRLAQRELRPSFRAAFCLAAGEPASLLGEEFELLEFGDLDLPGQALRRLIARRRPAEAG